MATYNVTATLTELAALGVTPTAGRLRYRDARGATIEIQLFSNGTEVSGRRDEAAIHDMLHTARAAARQGLATDRQIAYITSLDGHAAPSLTKAEASALLDSLTTGAAAARRAGASHGVRGEVWDR
jgi:hypothetical protein